MPNLFVSAISTWDGKALAKGQKQIGGFDKAVTDLGKKFIAVFSAQKIIAYGKASAMAFAADEKSASLLAQQLKNLGVAYSIPTAEGFIKSLETQVHIADDLLRPAYAQLARVTGSLTKTQQIMSAAFDISNGAGLGYSQTIDILSQAYVGNTKGLKQLNTGLTNAETAALSFDELLVLLNKHFSGAGAEALKTYSAQMDALNIALGNAQENIGGGLLDAFAELAGNGNIDKANGKIEKFSTTLGNLVRVIAGVEGFDPGKLSYKFGFIPQNKPQGMGNVAMSVSSQDNQKAVLAKSKAAADKLAREKAAELKLLKDKNNQTLLEAKLKKEQAALDELKKRYDTERLGLVAALAKATDEDTRRRIRDQIAILDGNASIAEKALNEMDKAQKDRIGLELAAAQSLAKLAAAADGVFTIFTTKVPFIGTEQGPGLKPKVDPITQAEIDAAEQDKIAFQKELEAKKAAEAAAAAKAAAEEAARNSTAGILGRIYDQRHKDDPSYFNPDYSKNTGAGVTGMGTGNTTNGDVVIDNSIHIGEGGTVIDSNEITEIVKKAVQQNNRYGSSLQYAGNIAV